MLAMCVIVFLLLSGLVSFMVYSAAIHLFTQAVVPLINRVNMLFLRDNVKGLFEAYSQICW